MAIYQCASSHGGFLPNADTFLGFVAVATDQAGSHTDICPIFDNNGPMPLILSVASKIYPVRNRHIVADLHEIVAHIIQIALHANKYIFADLEATDPIQQDTDHIERTIGRKSVDDVFPNRLKDHREERIVVEIRCRFARKLFITKFQ